MTGIRLYVFDRHGRHYNGDERAVRARQSHLCAGHYPVRHIIKPGDWYVIATQYPSDDDFAWLDRDTLKPSRSAYRIKVCRECMGKPQRDLIAALALDLGGAW